MASQTANNFKEQLLKKEIDFDADTFKVILMASGFVFAKTTHALYADVLASELTTANGYTAGGATLAGISVSQDDTNHRGLVTWNNVVWTVATAALTASGAIIYDDTVAAAPGADIIVGYIDFGGNIVTAVGGTLTLASIAVSIY